MWVHRLMVEERSRTRMLAPVPYCPARLPNIRFDEISYDNNTKRKNACATYEEARASGEWPSQKKCQHCQYNTDSIRRGSDPGLVRAVVAHFAK